MSVDAALGFFIGYIAVLLVRTIQAGRSRTAMPGVRMKQWLGIVLHWLRTGGLMLVAAVPFVMGMITGAVVSLVLWCVAAVLAGYSAGRQS